MILINEKIIYESKILLKNSDLSIKEISNIFGYSEATHFTYFFKKYSGLTPSEFKKLKNNF